MPQLPGNYSHKQIEWLQKWKYDQKSLVLCFLEDINVENILIVID